jgi:transposase
VRQEERIAHLERENAALRAELAARLKRLEHRLAKDSHNSSQPPSRDGVARKRQKQRKASEKRSGGQVGHTGRTLLRTTTPDEVVSHRPGICQHCQQPLEGVQGEVKEQRQVHDVPLVHLVVREHQVERVCCPA